MTSSGGAVRNSPVGEAGSFADRLNRLFAAVHPPLRGPYTSQEMIHALRGRGYKLSAPYLSQLRTGERVCPSEQTVNMIADFFGVRSEYFTDPEGNYGRHVDSELRWLELARDPDVRRLTTMLLELSTETRERLIDSETAVHA